MSSPAFSLILCLPDEAPARHDLTHESITIGRSPENGLQILVAEVSVTHGSLARAGESFVLTDSGSTNGTTVNGAPVGPEGVTLSAMDKIVFGTLVPAYFVPAVVLETTPMEELIASIEAAPKTAPLAVQIKTAPVAVRAAVPLAAGVAPGATTVKLDQVRAPSPGGAVPAPVPLAPRQPLPGAPAGGPPKPPGVPGAPVAPAPLRAPGVAPLAAPLAAPRPVGGQPAKLPTALPPVGAPAPIPIKRVAPGAPTIPLPKPPPRPGQ